MTWQIKRYTPMKTYKTLAAATTLAVAAILPATSHAQAVEVLSGAVPACERDDERGVRTYRVTGQIFFATAEAFHSAFDFREEDLKGVVIDLQASHFWDITSINALDRVMLKFRHHDIPVEIVGINEATASMIERLAVHDKPGALARPGH